MTWLAVLALAGIAFLAAALALKISRGSWTMLGATLLFGLTGYAWQGSPSQPAAPGSTVQQQEVDGELLVQARREFFDSSQLPTRWVVTADSYVRRGDFARAAGFYRNAVEEGPLDTEAWLGLGIALVEHAKGNLTPAALRAFEQAQSLEEDNAGARYFLGLSWLRAGEPERTRELWREALAAAPEDAPWREALALRLYRLESLLQPRQVPE